VHITSGPAGDDFPPTKQISAIRHRLSLHSKINGNFDVLDLETSESTQVNSEFHFGRRISYSGHLT
jgi:hypothetical protein